MLAALASALLLAVSPASSGTDRGTDRGTDHGPFAPVPVIVLDPGHGGEKEGARSVEGRWEKDITLQVARLMKVRLEGLGAKVVLTRTGDQTVDLPRRAAIANDAEADLFISIHLNAAPAGPGSQAHGIETYFLAADATDEAARAVAMRENADRPRSASTDPLAGILDDLEDQANLAASSRLAHTLHRALVRGTAAPDRGVKQAPFVVLAGARMAAVLLELGFSTHRTEGRELARRPRQEAIADAVAAGIVEWWREANVRVEAR